MLALVAIALLGQQLGPCGVDGPIYCGGASLALFEFAPPNAAGMTPACACTAPTGAKGEALTFTRASSGTCLVGSTTSGIANGDMVTCSTNQSRVMPGGDGSGGLGLLVEGTRTNTSLRSQELENAVWVPLNNGIAAPTITANAAVAPDGTTTAERFQAAAATGANYSELFQTAGCTASTASTASIFIKGNGTSGSFDFGVSGSTAVCTQCTYVAGSWSRCTIPFNLGGTPGIFFGPTSPGVNAGCGGQAADVFLWGPDCEVGAYATSYIATVGAPVTRATDSAKFGGVAAVASTGSAAATVILYSGTVDAVNHPAVISTNAGGRYVYAWEQIGARFFDGTNTFVQALTYTPNVAKRIFSFWSGASATVGSSTDNLSTSGAFDGTMDTANLYVGSSDTAGETLDGVIKRVCVDPSTSRCR